MNAESDSKYLKPQPSILLLIVAVLVPLVGIILYLSNRTKQVAAHWYLWAASVGVILTAIGKYLFPGILGRIFHFLFDDFFPLLLGIVTI